MEVWEVRGHHHAIRAVFIGADQYDSGETPLTEVKGHRTGTSMYVVIVQSECSTHPQTSSLQHKDSDSKCVVEGDNFCH